MRILRSLLAAAVVLSLTGLLMAPAFGKTIDNSQPPGHDVAPGLAGRAEFTVRIIAAGQSGNTILVDPIHICGSGRGG